jgi:single-strand DNA-binding protein
MNLNKVFLIGRLTRDPESKTTPSGQTVCNFSIATNRVWSQNNQKQEKTEFHNIVVWQRLAEIASQYLKKGSVVLVEGRLQTRSWQDQAGTKKYKTEIIAENLQLGPRAISSSNYQARTKNSPASGPADGSPDDNIPIIEENPSGGEDKEINVKDIPF